MGGLVKHEGGTLTFTGTNTYTYIGTTSVSGGVFQVGVGRTPGTVASGSVSVSAGSKYVAYRGNTNCITIAVGV